MVSILLCWEVVGADPIAKDRGLPFELARFVLRVNPVKDVLLFGLGTH